MSGVNVEMFGYRCVPSPMFAWHGHTVESLTLLLLPVHYDTKYHDSGFKWFDLLDFDTVFSVCVSLILHFCYLTDACLKNV